MKNIIILGIMLFIISSQVFADENASFIWQLNDNQENSQKINFINLNPVFFNDYFLLRISKNISPSPNYLSNRNIQTISQDDDIDELTTILLIPLYFFFGNLRPGPEIQTYESYELLRRQRETENIYRGISPYPSRILYQ